MLSAAAGYQLTMDDLAPRGSLDVWQRASRADDLAFAGAEIDARSQAVVARPSRRRGRRTTGACSTGSASAGPDGGWRFREEPPILVRVDAATREAVTSGLEHYADTLPRERRFMLSRYQVVDDVAHPSSGVGSVGTGPTWPCCAATRIRTRSSCR